MDNFYHRLRGAVKAFGTQQELAAEANISLSMLRRYLSGESQPTIEPLVALAKVLGVSLNWLTTGQGPMRVVEEATGIPQPPLECSELVFDVWEACENILAEEGIRAYDQAKLRPLVRAICQHVADDMRDKAHGEGVGADLSRYKPFIRLIGQ